MTEKRVDREQETRAASARKTSWNRPETLPAPNPQEGYEFHWVRISTLGQVDATNVSAKLREGWEPCKAKDHPEISMVVTESERFKDNIVIGGLMLCKAPVELVRERTDFFQNQTKSQMSAVDNNLMRENDPRMPIFNDRKTKVTFGQGT